MHVRGREARVNRRPCVELTSIVVSRNVLTSASSAARVKGVCLVASLDSERLWTFLLKRSKTLPT